MALAFPAIDPIVVQIGPFAKPRTGGRERTLERRPRARLHRLLVVHAPGGMRVPILVRGCGRLANFAVPPQDLPSALFVLEDSSARGEIAEAAMEAEGGSTASEVQRLARALAIGAGSEGAQTALQEQYHKNLTLEEGETMAVTILKQVMEEKLAEAEKNLGRLEGAGVLAEEARKRADAASQRAKAAEDSVKSTNDNEDNCDVH